MPAWIARERTKLMAAIDPWISASDRGAATVLVILPALALVPRGVPRLRGIRFFPAAAHDVAGHGSAGAQR
jgi:hypothetical protein